MSHGKFAGGFNEENEIAVQRLRGAFNIFNSKPNTRQLLSVLKGLERIV
jgi:hypothetical protein